jgi:hypothetical protein
MYRFSIRKKRENKVIYFYVMSYKHSDSFNERMCRMADLTPNQQAILDDALQRLDNPSQVEEGTNMLDPTNAHAFYQLAYGVWHKLFCPMGHEGRLIYNPELNMCDESENVSPDINPAPREAGEF